MEAAKGLKTINQIAAENELHTVQVSQWKKELLEGAAAVFEREGTAKKQLGAIARDLANQQIPPMPSAPTSALCASA